MSKESFNDGDILEDKNQIIRKDGDKDRDIVTDNKEEGTEMK